MTSSVSAIAISVARSASLRRSFRRIAQARSVEVEVRVGARDLDMGIAAVSTPFTRRALADNVDLSTLVLLHSIHDHLVDDTHLREWLHASWDASHRGDMAERPSKVRRTGRLRVPPEGFGS